MTYDSKCRQLAEYWLDGEDDLELASEKIVHQLACRIQRTIEEFIEELGCDRQEELEAARDKAAEDKMDERRLEGRK